AKGVFGLTLGYKTAPAKGDAPEEDAAGDEEESDAEDGGVYEGSSGNTKIVVWTNIGLMAHWLDNSLVVFAHDLFAITPIANAKLTLWSNKNQVMGEGSTDADGIAQLKSLDKSLGTPSVLVCETGDDYTFLQLTPRQDDGVPTGEAMPRFDRAAYDA